MCLLCCLLVQTGRYSQGLCLVLDEIRLASTDVLAPQMLWCFCHTAVPAFVHEWFSSPLHILCLSACMLASLLSACLCCAPACLCEECCACVVGIGGGSTRQAVRSGSKVTGCGKHCWWGGPCCVGIRYGCELYARQHPWLPSLHYTLPSLATLVGCIVFAWQCLWGSLCSPPFCAVHAGMHGQCVNDCPLQQLVVWLRSCFVQE